MRRLLLGLAVTALTVLAFAGPASAASAQVSKLRFSGAFAEAAWFTSSASSNISTFINVSQSNPNTELFVDQFVVNLDANGNVTGTTDTSADVFSGFSFTIDQGHLASASTSASGVPATACTFDAGGNSTGCSDTTIDLNASWTGQGPITRSVANSLFKGDGFSVNDHFNGTFRNAVATGTIAGITFNAADVAFADFGTAKSGTVVVCRGTGC